MRPFSSANWLKVDPLLLFSVLFLVVIGISAVYSASSYRADTMVQRRLLREAQKAQEEGDQERAEKLLRQAKSVDGSGYYIRKQIGKLLIGLLLMAVVVAVPYERLLAWSPIFLLISIALLILLLLPLPFVVRRDAAARWLNFFGFTFQPSDFARYALILFLARILYDAREFLNNWKVYLTILGVIFIVVGLVAVEKDLGTAAMITVIAFTMLFFAGVRIGFLFLTGMSFFAVALIYLQINPYMLDRMIKFLAPLFGVGRHAFQIEQSLISFALGGPFGVGVGSSVQKYDFLPEAHKDMIFSIIGEEMGFIGAVWLLVLFAVVIYRGIHIAVTAPSGYGRLLAGGITACIAVYAVINAAVALALLPTTGVPMPFISYGGSALISHLMGVGILLNLSTRSTPSALYEDEATLSRRVRTMTFSGNSRMRGAGRSPSIVFRG